MASSIPKSQAQSRQRMEKDLQEQIARHTSVSDTSNLSGENLASEHLVVLSPPEPNVHAGIGRPELLSTSVGASERAATIFLCPDQS